jgi:hypothetical protein
VRSVVWGDGLTGRTRYVLVRSIAVLLVGNALALVVSEGTSSGSSPAAIDGAGGPSAGAQDPSSSTSGSTTTTAAPSSGATSGQGQGAGTTATTTAAPPTTLPATTGNYSYTVTLEPTCARVGELFTLTIRGEPGAAAGVIAVHADGDTHKTMWGKAAGPDGVLVRTWAAPPAPGRDAIRGGNAR